MLSSLGLPKLKDMVTTGEVTDRGKDIILIGYVWEWSQTYALILQ